MAEKLIYKTLVDKLKDKLSEQPDITAGELKSYVSGWTECAMLIPVIEDSWHETHFEIVSMLLDQTDLNGAFVGKVDDIYTQHGTGGMYEFAYQLTNEFETKYRDRLWDGDWFDVLGEFMEEKLND